MVGGLAAWRVVVYGRREYIVAAMMRKYVPRGESRFLQTCHVPWTDSVPSTPFWTVCVMWQARSRSSSSSFYHLLAEAGMSQDGETLCRCMGKCQRLAASM